MRSYMCRAKDIFQIFLIKMGNGPSALQKRVAELKEEARILREVEDMEVRNRETRIRTAKLRDIAPEETWTFDRHLRMAMNDIGNLQESSKSNIVQEKHNIDIHSESGMNNVVLGVCVDEDCTLSLEVTHGSTKYIIWKRPQKANVWTPIFPKDVDIPNLRGAYTRFLYFTPVYMVSDKETTNIQLQYVKISGVEFPSYSGTTVFNGGLERANSGHLN